MEARKFRRIGQESSRCGISETINVQIDVHPGSFSGNSFPEMIGGSTYWFKILKRPASGQLLGPASFVP